MAWKSILIDGVNATNAYSVLDAGVGSTVNNLTVRNIRVDNRDTLRPALNLAGAIGNLYWDNFSTAGSLGILPYQLAGTIGTVFTPTTHPNLVLNGSDLTQSSWILGGATTTAGVITVTASGSNVVRQVVNVVPGWYTFSFQAKAGTLTFPTYRVYDSSHNADIIPRTSYTNLINSTTFTQVSTSFFVPLGCSVINVYLMSDGTSTGTVSIQGATLQ
jgi:hypothetical protein